jgi:hypothetical protein
VLASRRNNRFLLRLPPYFPSGGVHYYLPLRYYSQQELQVDYVWKADWNTGKILFLLVRCSVYHRTAMLRPHHGRTDIGRQWNSCTSTSSADRFRLLIFLSEVLPGIVSMIGGLRSACRAQRRFIVSAIHAPNPSSEVCPDPEDYSDI